MILNRLASDIDAVFARITEPQLRRYDQLQRSLLVTNVASDIPYQTTFNGYYRMQRRTQDWYRFFFSVLEREKRNDEITFRQIIEEVYGTGHRVEPSFSSKLVATIRPELPVYDKYIRENLSLVIPRQNEPPEDRVREFIGVYSLLETQMTELVRSETFRELKKRFDDRFSTYVHFTDVKKLDLLLWQYRQV